MPEKSIRDMSVLERRRHSLAAKTVRSTLMISFLMAVIALLIGLGFYGYDLSKEYIKNAFDIARNVSASLETGNDPQPYVDEIMGIYRSLSAEERQATGTDAYRARFSEATSGEAFKKVLAAMYYEHSRTSDDYVIYLAMYDRDTRAMVYLADPEMEEPDGLYPGDWEPVKEKGMRKFLEWDGSRRLFDVGKTEKYGYICTVGYPLYGADGQPYAFSLVDMSVSYVIEGMHDFALQLLVAMLGLAILIAWFLTLAMKKTLVKPINDIAEAALAYVQDRRAGVLRSDHFSSLDVHTGDEVENLALIMGDMENDLNEIEGSLTAVTAQNERISTELSLATRIQAAFVPHIFPPFPNRPEFDIYASMDPAKEVGGDFYDFFLIDEDHLGLVMADVSGKGVPAALFMMVTKIILKNSAMLGQGPAAVLTKANESISANNQEDMFVTVWIGILEISTGRLTCANAGHEYPVLRKPDGNFELVKDKHGFVVGGMSGIKYREYELQLEPGAKLFLYTDGVPEASNAENELFGIERMLDALNAAPDAAPKDILSTVHRALRGFVKAAEQFDDVTMLCLDYKGPGEEQPMKKLTVDAKVENIDAVTEFVDQELYALDCPIKARMQIDVAIDEIMSNISRYAYGDGTGPVTVLFGQEKDPKVVRLTFIDHGVPYDPLQKVDPDTSLSLDDRPIGGLGIFLVKKTMDSMSYEYKDGENVLTLQKKIIP